MLIEGDVHHVGINVADIDSSLNFYCSELNLSEIRRWENGERQGKLDGLEGNSDVDISQTDAEACYLQVKDLFLEIVEYRYPEADQPLALKPSNVCGRSHLCFEVTGIGPLYRSLSEKYEFISRPVMSSSGGLMVKCFDPSGNLIEFYESEESLGSGEEGSVKSIHHLGINVPDIDVALEFYQETFGFDLVRRYEPQLSVDPFVSGLDPADAVTEIAFLDTGNFELELLEYPDSEFVHLNEFDIGRAHLGFIVDDVDQLYARYNDSIDFLSPPQTSPTGTTVIKCYDSYGYSIEFIDPGRWLEDLGPS
ncbi:Catechol 2,3-dioxygenase [Halopenitus malekzadehii]|uniref:Catechol 2,3-dioxygenase n=1 Tax=Halopenitus malekzadehii TaxID=1267564 RepID=A0A1H6K680_9EURY|nr:VOC family protein [Halopenitus malekzadehii]SEH68514.1 Catechol 2,3-dioxygenase [Halopenitus malekzadehii]